MMHLSTILLNSTVLKPDPFLPISKLSIALFLMLGCFPGTIYQQS